MLARSSIAMLSSSAVVANRPYLAIVPIGRGSFLFFQAEMVQNAGSGRRVDRRHYRFILDPTLILEIRDIFSFNKPLVIRQYRSTTGSNWNRKASTKPPKRVLVSLEIIAGCAQHYGEN